MIKNFLQFVKENLDNNTGPVIKKQFQVSDNFKDILKPLFDDYEVAKLLLNLIQGVDTNLLIENPADFLNIEDDGNFSYLKKRYFNEPDPWTNRRRLTQSLKKCLKEIYKMEVINSIHETEYQKFLVKLAAIVEANKITVLEWRGEELLRAYNFKNELIKGFGMSCANFHQKGNNFGDYEEPTVGEFDIYVKNPENCGVVVLMQEGKIIGRKSFQQGESLVSGEGVKKGDMVTVSGYYYGLSGRGSKYETILTDYLISKYNAFSLDTYNKLFVIKIETRFERYCPFDSMYVSFTHNLLANSYTRGLLRNTERNVEWENSYHAHCPPRLVNNRLKDIPTLELKTTHLNNN